MRLGRERRVPQGNPLRELLIWFIKMLVMLYSVAIIGGTIATIWVNDNVILTVLASLTGLLTSALGGLFIAMRKQNDPD